jgi:hypothetical protein
MSAQTTVDETTRFEQLLADLKIPSGDLTGVPQQFAGAVAEAGFEASTGTIAFAGQHPNGDYSVEFNNMNGGFPPPGRTGPSNLPRRRCCRNSAQRPKHSKR